MGVTQKICIGLPTNRGLRPKCLQSLLEMVAHTKVEYHIALATEGYTTAENRSFIVAEALRNNCTHILYLDDDMVYEKNSLERLLAHDKDIVGAKYHVRRDVESENPDVIEYFDEESDKNRTDLFKCKALGGGLILIKTDVFTKVRQPHFWYKVRDNGMIEMSHDWYFAEKARASGFDIWCDGSLYPGHLGIKEY